MSDGNEFADELGVLEARDNAPQFASIFNIAGAFGENVEGGSRGVQQVIWTGGRRGKLRSNFSDLDLKSSQRFLKRLMFLADPETFHLLQRRPLTHYFLM
jgi:hypothetical protein